MENNTEFYKLGEEIGALLAQVVNDITSAVYINIGFSIFNSILLIIGLLYVKNKIK
jgi:hypothetical protein